MDFWNSEISSDGEFPAKMMIEGVEFFKNATLEFLILHFAATEMVVQTQRMSVLHKTIKTGFSQKGNLFHFQCPCGFFSTRLKTNITKLTSPNSLNAPLWRFLRAIQ